MRQRLVLVVGVSLLLTVSARAEDWLQWGGPAGDFTVETNGLADWWPADGPRVVWKRALGEGYSSILAKGDRLFTMYRDNEREEEVVVALDAGTGETKWEHRYAVEPWEDMTDDFGLGPNATPLIVGDRIVSIGIDGQLRCLGLDRGKLLWKLDLPAVYGRRERDEEYGYSNSPMHHEGKILVLVGGDDHAVVALDPADGSVIWESATGGVSYAPTTFVMLGGREQFVYFAPEGVVGLDPSTGLSLWQHEIEYNNGNHLTPIVQCDESHIWVSSQFPSGGGRVLEVKLDDETWTTRELWFAANLRASHWPLIRIGDFVYGSTGGNEVSVLSAIDWKTGEIAWRRRGFHKAQALYADDKLIFLDEDGELALTRISPEGLEVLDTAQVTESISWSLPTLVDTTLYLRDRMNILALDLAHSGGERPTKDRGRSEAAELLGEFGQFVRKVTDSEDKRSMIDAFMEQQETFPIVEGDLVHFVFRGDVPDVAIRGNFLPMNELEPLYFVDGTDFYFRSYRLPAAAHFEYRFNVFEEEMLDPLNPRRLTPSEEDNSVVTTAGWVEPPHLQEPQGPRGRIVTFPWKSEILGNEREISVYLPPGYDSDDARYPVVLVNYGDQALDRGRWADSLDNLIGETVVPLIAVFLPRVDFDEYASRVVQFSEAIATELLSHVDGQYRTLPGAENRAMTGIASGGFASAFIGLSRPGLLGNVATQSFYFRSEAEDTLRSMIANGEGKTTRFYVEWSVNDLAGNDELQSEAASRELAALLKDGGYDVVTNEVSDGAGWGSWRARTDRILETFFALVTDSEAASRALPRP